MGATGNPVGLTPQHRRVPRMVLPVAVKRTPDVGGKNPVRQKDARPGPQTRVPPGHLWNLPEDRMAMKRLRPPEPEPAASQEPPGGLVIWNSHTADSRCHILGNDG